MSQSGVDVSSYQGTVDWTQFAGGGSTFAFIKATEGLHTVDSQFARNWATAKSAGLVRGAYHFFYPHLDPVGQARHFSQIVDIEAGDLPPVLDLEVADNFTPSALAGVVQQFLDALERAKGAPPIIYVSPGFWTGSMGNSTAFGKYPLWVAHWGVALPTVPSNWSDWTFWQTSAHGHVPGISGEVDLDQFNDASNTLQSAAIATRTLAVGAIGPEVSALQQALAAGGADPGGADGIFGPNTQNAVKTFQTNHNLTSTGVVDDATRQALGL